ncbi:unnamed protein product [Cladocopium goreaui]|uniref:tRNA-dihydrouridine(20) synthase [NAD(P)+] n=1 Tax=Cladocopium goreaui TaxID=2562237 RepID=A0A9P1M496_9DINO|nr:unnamed protein product [Cladocopium goreaui]
MSMATVALKALYEVLPRMSPRQSVDVFWLFCFSASHPRKVLREELVMMRHGAEEVDMDVVMVITPYEIRTNVEGVANRLRDLEEEVHALAQRSSSSSEAFSPQAAHTAATSLRSEGINGIACGATAPCAPRRFGPLDVNLKPTDQLRPLLPTWNPPPTRRPEAHELEVSTRLRFLFEERWWAATVREAYETEVRVGFDGWPSRHDQILPRNTDLLYLHESVHPDYVAPPKPQRFQRPTVDAEGKEIPTLRQPRPKVYDPEKERMKRALRPPMPFNPEKERLKRLLRQQVSE